MKHLTILYPAGRSDFSTISCITGAFEMFASANGYRRRSGRGNLFTVELAGTSGGEEMYDGMLAIKPQRHISAIAKTDLILIPSIASGRLQAAGQDGQLLDWIVRQYKQGAEVASVCSGAFLLASTHLLDGRNCSTHWSHAETFKRQFPEVNLVTDQLITDEYGIYTNGGAYSFLNLLVYLVEKYYDRPTAIFCSKVLQIEMDRNSQSAFAIFTGQKLHGDKMVEEAQQYIEQALQDKISVEEISARFAVGRRNFDRRFIKATGNTPMEYSQRVKIEWAKKELEASRKTVGEIMYEVGYSDQKAFRELFRKITGMSPLEYRSKYNKDAALS